MGADLAYEIEIDGEEYLHVYREEVKEEDLHTKHILYRLNEQKKTEEVEEDEAIGFPSASLLPIICCGLKTLAKIRDCIIRIEEFLHS